MNKKIKDKISDVGWHLNRLQRSSLKSFQSDLKALHHLPELNLHYIPWTVPALRPSAVAALMNEVVIHRRRNILEFGAGVSTLYLADLLSSMELKGRIISVEENGDWCEVVEEYLDDLGISSRYVQIVESPLRDYHEKSECDRWYDTEVLKESLSGKTFDMVLVGGPSAMEKGQEMARLPALNFVRSYLSSDFSLFLDDIERDGENKIGGIWQEKLGVEYIVVSGMGCFRPKSPEKYYDIKI